ncbi:unnamed protein product [Ilex paraguariensis]|uniref:Serine-threonine/tyrosine-protein kinase catalytic domain-containing protein n=1 Tax=Ilex paraguariensis TaxID=185542 RepID=A0ABC8RAS9_9AQUA
MQLWPPEIIVLSSELILECKTGVNAPTNEHVHSYGVLLLEMFTGRRPTDDRFKDSLNLHNYVSRAIAKTSSTDSEPSTTCTRRSIRKERESNHSSRNRRRGTQ